VSDAAGATLIVLYVGIVLGALIRGWLDEWLDNQ
jgi:hypothetical protein